MKITGKIIDIQRIFKKIQHAIATEETRYYLNGVCLEKKDGKIHFIATDGHQFAMVDITNNENIAIKSNVKHFSAIIAHHTVKAILAIKPYSKFSTMIITIKTSRELNNGKITFEYSNPRGQDCMSQTHGLIDATYPEWRKVLPKTNKSVVMLDAKYLLNLSKAWQNNENLQGLIFNLSKETPSISPVTFYDKDGGTFLIMPMRMM